MTMERLLSASHDHKCSVFAAMKNREVTGHYPPRIRESIDDLCPSWKGGAPNCMARTAAARVAVGLGGRLSQGDRYFEELRRGEKNSRTPRAASATSRTSSPRWMTRAWQTPRFSARLNTFLEEMALDSDRESEDDKPQDAVTLITMHSCKGLEFPHVYIVGLEDG